MRGFVQIKIAGSKWDRKQDPNGRAHFYMKNKLEWLNYILLIKNYV